MIDPASCADRIQSISSRKICSANIGGSVATRHPHLAAPNSFEVIATCDKGTTITSKLNSLLQGGNRSDLHASGIYDKTELLRDIINVGPLKPIGYLPRYTIRRFLKTTPKALAASAVKRGLAVAEFTTANSGIQSGALYVYDRNALDSLLKKQAEAVQAAGLPLHADAFVAHIAAVFYDSDHPAYGIIATAFGERPLEVGSCGDFPLLRK